MHTLRHFYDRVLTLLLAWVTPQSPDTSRHFQERNLRVTVLVGVPFFILIFLIGLINAGSLTPQLMVLFSFSAGLTLIIGYIVDRGNIQLASRILPITIVIVLVDSTAAYWSPGTVLLSVLFSFAFLLIAPSTKELVLPIGLNILIYIGLAIWGPQPSPLLKGDFYAHPLTAIISTLMGHLMILSIGLYIRYDQAQKDRRILQSEQERAKILQRFIANTTHDLRTPLTSIKVSAYLLNKLATEQQQSRLSILESDVARLEAILNDMLDMSRFDAGIGFEPKLYDLATLLQELASSYQRPVKEKELTLRLEPLPLPIKIYADGPYLRRALGNMLENAIQFTPNKGEIVIRAVVNRQHIIIQVCDSGTGIASEDLPHIFEGFYRADPARNSASGRSGLGLAIAKRAIEKHNGKIEVHSTVGEGTTFSIILPAVA